MKPTEDEVRVAIDVLNARDASPALKMAADGVIRRVLEPEPAKGPERAPVDEHAPVDAGEARESDGALLARLGTDAHAWAEAFAARARKGIPTTEWVDFLTAWFADAIEAGRTAGITEGQPRRATTQPEATERRPVDPAVIAERMRRRANAIMEAEGPMDGYLRAGGVNGAMFQAIAAEIVLARLGERGA